MATEKLVINGNGFDQQKTLNLLFDTYAGRLIGVMPFDHMGVSGTSLHKASLDGHSVIIKIGEKIGHLL